MTNGNRTSTRFKDELSIISPWAFSLAALGFLSMVLLLVILIGRDHDAPPVAVRWLLGIITGALLGCYIVLIGYVNRDAGRRGMSRLLWLRSLSPMDWESSSILSCASRAPPSVLNVTRRSSRALAFVPSAATVCSRFAHIASAA
jgi:ABC-type Fe3+-siderophore transport system permease subunit